MGATGDEPNIFDKKIMLPSAAIIRGITINMLNKPIIMSSLSTLLIKVCL